MKKIKIDRKFPHSDRLIDQEIQKVRESGKIPPRDYKYVDIYREKQIRVTIKVLVPIREHPKFNFVGKLLGPKGNSMKRLQEETMCRIVVLGRGSMKDHKREEELRNSLEPKYAHLNDDLHVEISTLAPPAEAHARIAFALAEVRKYLIPDSNDFIRQEQLRELLSDPTIPPPTTEHGPPYKKSLVSSKSYGRRPPLTPPIHSPIPVGSSAAAARTVMSSKQKILSILDRARSAMDETYSARYEDPDGHYEPEPYEYGYNHSSAVPSKSKYDAADYHHSEYRRDYYRESPTYVKPSSSSRSTWKTSGSSYPSSSRHEESSSSKHSHSHSSRDRYRSSPYSKPSK